MIWFIAVVITAIILMIRGLFSGDYIQFIAGLMLFVVLKNEWI